MTIQDHIRGRDAFFTLVEEELGRELNTGHRGMLCNSFLFPVRQEGASDPDAICRYVYLNLKRMWDRERQPSRFHEPNDERLSRLYAAMKVLATHKDAGRDAARWAIAWEALPHDERTAIKEARKSEYVRASMEGKPATDKQHAFLVHLGYDGAPPSDRLHASTLIDQLTTNRSTN